jgi:hypothetical protein
MINYHTLTKRVDQGELLPALISAGVTAGISIDGEKVYLSGLDEATTTEQLAIVASVVSAHEPTTFTECALSAAPHIRKFCEECSAVDGVTSIGVELPSSYPGTAVLVHNSLTVGQRTNLVAAAEAHDASSVPALSVDTPSQVIAANNSATGAVTVTDSRGAAAEGKTVRLRIPPGGAAGADGDSFVLDASGQATVTFQETTIFTGELDFEFYYASGEADPVWFKVRRGTV